MPGLHRRGHRLVRQRCRPLDRVAPGSRRDRHTGPRRWQRDQRCERGCGAGCSGSGRPHHAAAESPPSAPAPSSGLRPDLLDGRCVTTHWAHAERLAKEFPTLSVDADPIYIHDGKYWTSAGVTAGIDLALGTGAGRPGRRRCADCGPLARDVPASAGRADAVRITGVGAARRALDRACGADAGGVGAGWRSPCTRHG